MEFVGETIILDRELSELDRFTLDFIKVLRKHTDYVIVSGYVSILLGRARSSEDVDVIIPKMKTADFAALYSEITANGFVCLNADGASKVYEYLADRIAVRFARDGTAIPNMEVKFAKDKFDDISLKKTLRVKTKSHEIIISHLEMQIAFKEAVLKSPKDIEDARHIRNIAAGHLDERLIAEYKRMLDGH